MHPGYGFLAENAGFARACEEAGLVWIGPPPEAIELMGSKTVARETMRAAGVPIVPGTTDPVTLGRGRRAPRGRARLPADRQGRRRRRRQGDEARPLGRRGRARLRVGAPRGAGVLRQRATSTSSATSWIRATSRCRCSPTGTATSVHLGERDCTIQRRHQKLIEETPSPAVDEELRARIGRIAVDAARAAGYRSAGTIEGLLSADGDYYFMEMNTRIQVEHTVTEAVTGIDLVREQLRIAAGEPLSCDAGGRFGSAATRSSAGSTPRTSPRGFLPAPGTITAYREPAGPGVRVDSGVAAGSEISPLYDPMIAKLIVHDVDREQRAPADAARARRVRDRRREDAARLPPGAAPPSVLRRGRHLPRDRRVGGAGRRGRRARAVAGAGGRDAERPRARAGHAGRGRRAPLRRQGARARAAVGRARAPPARAAAQPPAAPPTRRS